MPQQPITKKFTMGGLEYTIETGKLATQADGLRSSACRRLYATRYRMRQQRP